MGKYIAVHIRRTDHTEVAKSHNKFTNDDEFINFINKFPDYNLYIATDNYETQEKFYNLFKNKIKIINIIDQNNTNLRKTSLLDSIIDIYMCINSNYFMGSGYSSFSQFIDYKRATNNFN